MGIFQYLWIYQKPSVLSNPVSSWQDRLYHGNISPGRGRDCLRETEIGILEERELEPVVLADRHQRACGIETLETNERVNAADNKSSWWPYIREEEEGNEVNESVRKSSVLLQGRPNLGLFERAPWTPSGQDNLPASNR